MSDTKMSREQFIEKLVNRIDRFYKGDTASSPHNDVRALLNDKISQALQEDWISVEDEPLPKSTDEFLTLNKNCGNCLQLIRWNSIHNHFQNKGEYVAECNAGTHWQYINYSISIFSKLSFHSFT